jgi:hypothetical protein
LDALAKYADKLNQYELESMNTIGTLDQQQDRKVRSDEIEIERYERWANKKLVER